MKRFSLAGVTVATLAVVSLVLGGCSATTMKKTRTPKVWGYVASADKTKLDVAQTQLGAAELVVKRVLVPGDAWIVVDAESDGKRGARIGQVRVKQGESRDVKVPLQGLTSPQVIVTVHADHGAPGTFDFDPMNKEMSLDRPFFVNEIELAKVVAVRSYGVPTVREAASIVASNQVGVTNQLVISRVLAPSDAWALVSLEKNGGLGQRIGLVHVPTGESVSVTVTLDPLPLTPNLVVSLNTDVGAPGLFDFDPDDELGSPDQPFLVGGQKLSIRVRVK